MVPDSMRRSHLPVLPGYILGGATKVVLRAGAHGADRLACIGTPEQPPEKQKAGRLGPALLTEKLSIAELS